MSEPRQWQRFAVGSLTGYKGETSGLSKPPTTWYVHDRCNMSMPIAEYRHEYQARRHCLRLNAEERRWEKEVA